MRVAVVVVVHVVAPVRRRLVGQVVVVRLALEVAVEPVDGLVAAVGLRHRVDQDDHVPADLLDHRLLRDGEPVRELHDHLGAARLGGVQAGVEVVDGPRGRDDLLRLLRRRGAGIGERGGRGLEPVEVADALFVGDRGEEDLPALLGLPHHRHLHARSRLRELPEVAVDLARVRELAGRARHVPEVLRRRRDRVGRRDVGDPGISVFRLGRESRDRLDGAGLRGVGREGVIGRRGERQNERGGEAQRCGQASGHRGSSVRKRRSHE